MLLRWVFQQDNDRKLQSQQLQHNGVTTYIYIYIFIKGKCPVTMTSFDYLFRIHGTQIPVCVCQN